MQSAWRKLIHNTALTAGAFFVVSVVGLLLVPALIHTYGVAQFGLITLARVLLPSAALGLFDFGFSEIATAAVAKARQTGQWSAAGRMLGGLLAACIAVGALCCVAVVVGGDTLAALLKTPAEYSESFAAALRVTGACLLLFFSGLMIEGILKGFEAYRALRAIEVVTTLAYAASAVACMQAGLSFESVIYAFLGWLVARYLLALIAARRHMRRVGLRLAKPQAEELQTLRSQWRLMFGNRLIGVSQTQLPLILIGMLLGPAAVAIYDVISRLPRFTKSVLGLLNAGVLPLVARLNAAQDTQRLAKFGEAGLLLMASIVIPPLCVLAGFSDQVLRFWVGEQFQALGMWTALMFVQNALQSLVSIGGAGLLVTPHYLRQMNRLGFAQIALQYLATLLLVHWLQERAFVLGQFLAIALLIAAQVNLVARAHSLQRAVLKQVASVFALCALIVPMSFLMHPWLKQAPLWLVVLLMAGACVALWIAVFLLVMTPPQRRWLRQIGLALFSKKTA